MSRKLPPVTDRDRQVVLSWPRLGPLKEWLMRAQMTPSSVTVLRRPLWALSLGWAQRKWGKGFRVLGCKDRGHCRPWG
jgi:hypothetical protein